MGFSKKSNQKKSGVKINIIAVSDARATERNQSSSALAWIEKKIRFTKNWIESSRLFCISKNAKNVPNSPIPSGLVLILVRAGEPLPAIVTFSSLRIPHSWTRRRTLQAEKTKTCDFWYKNDITCSLPFWLNISGIGIRDLLIVSGAKLREQSESFLFASSSSYHPWGEAARVNSVLAPMAFPLSGLATIARVSYCRVTSNCHCCARPLLY